MTNQIDQIFLQRLTHLIQEVLSDEARFVNKNDQNNHILHEKIFTRGYDFKYQNLQEVEKLHFRKYFYVGTTGDMPRPDMPFTSSLSDQIFFFEQFQQQIKALTFNYSRMDLIRPSFADEKAAQPTFDQYQSKLVLMGLVYPCLYSLEQREISQQDKKKSGTATDQNVKVSANPYQTLGQKILVMGESGQYDTILTYDQLLHLSEQETIFRNQGFSDQQVVTQLQQYLSQHYPELHLALDANGHLQPFIPLKQNQQGQSVAVGFRELLLTLKVRQGRETQYSAILSSQGTLSFSNNSFQIIDANGITTVVDGLDLLIDQGGAGNNAIFFVQDQEGQTARVTVDTSSLRLEQGTIVNFNLYADPRVDLPGGRKIQLSRDQFNRLVIPLRTLYNQSQQPGDYDPTKDKRPLLSQGTNKPKSTLPGTSEASTAGDSSSTSSFDISLLIPHGTDAVTSHLPLSVPRTVTPSKTTTTRLQQTTKRVMPKIPASKPLPTPTKSPVSLPTTNQTTPSQQIQQPADTNLSSDTETSFAPSDQKKTFFTPFKIATISTAVPILGTIGTALGSALLK